MLRSLFEDEYILVIDKPPGLTVTRADSVKEPTLEDVLAENFPWALGIERSGIVHRLDKDTSGVMVVAKSEEALNEMQRLFHDRLISKTYQALVHGYFAEHEGLIEGEIARNPKNREKFTVIAGGREASTKYQVVGEYVLDPMVLLSERERITKKEKSYYQAHASGYSLVELYPKTGRTHQIRVHMHYLNHPLVSDAVYANKKLYRLDSTWCERHFLHACKLSFTHPFTQKEMSIDCGLPEDLRQALGTLDEGYK